MKREYNGCETRSTQEVPTEIRFPSPSSAFPPALTARGGVHPCSMNKFILVIDDSPTIQKVVEMTLRRAGYETRSFRDGVDTMRWFTGPESRTPDLMLVDLGLPKIDGYDLIQKFKAKPRFNDTVCIILSQRDGVVDKLKGKMVGAAAYITKPFTAQELVAAVQTYIADK